MLIARSSLSCVTLATVISALASTADAQVTGRAIAVGADVLQINGQAFQLWGVDAVEFHQSCYVDGRPWTCGASAVRAFQTLIDPVVVTCTETGEDTADPPIAVCTSAEGDLAEIMVRQGWARAFGPGADDYTAAEAAARSDALGIWQGQFVDPWAFREDIAAIERAYFTLVAEQVAIEAERRLAIGGDSPLPFQGFQILRSDGADGNASATEVRLGGVPYGAIRDTVGPQDIFDWAVAADDLWEWRQQIFDFLERTTSIALWTEFHSLPGPTVETADAIAYFSAMTEAATSLMAAGRQPVLLVSSIRTPSWIGDWLAGSPPDGANVVRKDEPMSPSYRGTINGVDIHVGPTPPNTSLIFPDDILVGVRYGELAGESFVAAMIDAAGDPDELVLRYARTLDWSGDPVTRIGFPPAAEEADLFYEVESP